MFSTVSQFDKLLDKATSKTLMEPDWETNLSICDCIRQNDISIQNAISTIFRKLSYNTNPRSQFYCLTVLESISKNCGSKVFETLLKKANLNELRTLAENAKHEIVLNKILEILQIWAVGMKNANGYENLKYIILKMKVDRFKFPEIKESDAMFVAGTAPNWSLAQNCSQCRQAFTLFRRRHHCRACGGTFCHECSPRFSIIPKYGYEKEVRVCNVCYEDLNKPAKSKTSKSPKNNNTDSTTKVLNEEETDLPKEYLESSLAKQSQVPVRKSEDEIREEEEFQLAVALSKSEAEQQEKRSSSSYLAVNDNRKLADIGQNLELESNTELARYLNRSYWESRSDLKGAEISDGNAVVSGNFSGLSPSAPTNVSVTSSNSDKIIINNQLDNEAVDENPKMKEFMKTLRTQIEIFVNRMKSNSSRGRLIANDSSVQTLFLTITSMHSQLLSYIQNYDDKRLYYERLQDKITQIKDARAALDALREEHREKLRQQAAEAEQKRQLQMAQKLEMMRKKKEEYLQYQRDLAMKRIQDDEREMIYRQAQQKQQHLAACRPPLQTNPFFDHYGQVPQQTQSHMQPMPSMIGMNPVNPLVLNQFHQQQQRLPFYPHLMSSGQPILNTLPVQQQNIPSLQPMQQSNLPLLQPMQQSNLPPLQTVQQPIQQSNPPLQQQPIPSSQANILNEPVKKEIVKPEVEVEELISFD